MSDVTGVERTLVLLKPDAVARGLVGNVLTRFENALLKIVATRMVWMDAELTRRHYFDLEERFGAGVYGAMADFMRSGPVIALVLEGVDAIVTTRKIVGSTYPDQAAPGTIRGDLAHMSKAYANSNRVAVANLVHASGNAEEAAREIDVWFAKDEIHEYRTAAQSYICLAEHMPGSA
jgi:nucleoside-diphosphate kinase